MVIFHSCLMFFVCLPEGTKQQPGKTPRAGGFFLLNAADAAGAAAIGFGGLEGFLAC